MKRKQPAIAAVGLVVGLCASPAFGSGAPPPTPEYVDHHGGTAAELARLYRGRLGIVMARSHSPMLYLQWRILHGLEVGEAAGAALAPSCCAEFDFDRPRTGVYGWLDARGRIPGVPASAYYLPLDRPGPDYTSIPNCFPDAFDTATGTLRHRAARHGESSPAVRAWLLTQDAVFAACSSDAAALPPPMADAPPWLQADRAYQEAAFALYNLRNTDAAARFASIALDRSSPWQPKALYLAARALLREALARPTTLSFGFARHAIDTLAAAPAGTYGHGEAEGMLRALDYRERPAELLARLDGELNRHEPAGDIEIRLRDYLSLSRRAASRPGAADWILAMRSDDRAAALATARERWAATRDVAWLIAALSHVSPGDPAAAMLASDAARVEPDHAGWTTARYHFIRLTIARTDPAETRARLDALLARRDLTLSDRNLFTAARAQVASDLDDFARFAMRRPYCEGWVEYDCAEQDRNREDDLLARRGRAGDWVGFGDDARAIIDRLPLPDRILLSRHADLPAPLRLDIALTNFARAVQLHDDARMDNVARDLAVLLPQLRGDWRRVAAERPGPAKRFAAYFVMAKIPGLRTDLVEFRRPLGTVPQFRGHWEDWIILPRGRSGGPPQFPTASNYRWDSYWLGGEQVDDLTCLNQCGAGAFPLNLPRFVAAQEADSATERSAFVTDATAPVDRPRTLPEGTVSAWEEMLAFARAHPRDPRSPEALYWLIRIARWGANRDHIGRRAFQLLHRRYPGSAWARRSPYYYDP